jgi:hypothetical protein
MSAKARAKALSQETNVGLRDFAAYNFQVYPKGGIAIIAPLILAVDPLPLTA